jgi:hypothetical protein
MATLRRLCCGEGRARRRYARHVDSALPVLARSGRGREAVNVCFGGSSGHGASVGRSGFHDWLVGIGPFPQIANVLGPSTAMISRTDHT